jgi:hypothetical protein
MKQPVKDSISQGRIPQRLMPVLHRELTGDDSRAAPVPVFQEFEHVAAVLIIPDSIGFRGWWKTCVSNRMITPLALYCVWSKQRRIGSQRHETIPRQEYLCAVR